MNAHDVLDPPTTSPEPPPAPPTPPRRRRTALVAGSLATASVLAFGLGTYAGVRTAGSDSATTSTGSTAGSSSGTTGGTAGGTTTSPGGSTGTVPGTGQTVPQMPSLPQQSLPGSGTGALDTTDATAAQSVGMVEITSTLQFGANEAAGTGMVLSADGEVVTNNHVVQDSTNIEVTVVSTGKTYTARVVGTDPTADVAVLQLVDASGLATVDTDTSGVAVNDSVTAVGDAGGDGGSLTAAEATVTATGQRITVDNEDGTTKTLRGLLQIDGDVVSGDSGGAVLDSSGQVVGMTTAASSGSANITGYAISIAKVLRIAAAAEAGQESSTLSLGYAAFLGVELSTSASATTTVAGVVSGSAAQDLGLAAGDVVTAVDGTRVSTAAQLRAALTAHDVGDTVRISWTDASGTSHSGSATLTEAPVG